MNCFDSRRVVLPEAIAAFDDMQAIVTVCAGILSENPALSKAYYTKNTSKCKTF